MCGEEGGCRKPFVETDQPLSFLELQAYDFLQLYQREATGRL